MPDLLADARWIFVEDSPFLPARGGGEREHLGMLVAARRAGVLAAVVLPGPADLDLAPYAAALGDVPVILAPRRERPWLLLHPRDPYTVASRPVPADLLARLRREAPGATGVVVTSAKSRRIGQAVAEGLGLPAVLRMHNREGEYHHALAAGTPGPRGLALGRPRPGRLAARHRRHLCRGRRLAGHDDDGAGGRRGAVRGRALARPRRRRGRRRCAGPCRGP